MKGEAMILGQDGLACDVEQLRGMVHGMAGIINRLASNRMVQEMTDLPLKELRGLADEYHQAVCPTAGELNLLMQAMYVEGMDDYEEE